MASLWALFLRALQSLWAIIVAAAARPQRRRLLVAGPSDAGKSTLLHRMRNPNPASLVSGSDIHLDVDIAPCSSPSSRTHHSHSPSRNKRTPKKRVRLILDAIDVGGFRYRDCPGGVHQLWRDCLASGDVDAVVFVIDAADYERLGQAGRLLGDLLRVLGERKGAGGGIGRETEMCARRGGRSMQLPVLVLGNKIDDHRAVAEEELRDLLGWSGLEASRQEGEAVQPVELFMCSAITGQGYQDGFVWLASHM
jgi:GTP-binding protein SAR1